MPHASARLRISPISPISPISRARRRLRSVSPVSIPAESSASRRRDPRVPRPAPPPPWRRAVSVRTRRHPRTLLSSPVPDRARSAPSLSPSPSRPERAAFETQSPPPFSSPPSRQGRDPRRARRPRSLRWCGGLRTLAESFARRQITRRARRRAPPPPWRRAVSAQTRRPPPRFQARSPSKALRRGSVAASRERSLLARLASGTVSSARVREPSAGDASAASTAAGARGGAASPGNRRGALVSASIMETSTSACSSTVSSSECTSSQVSSRRGSAESAGSGTGESTAAGRAVDPPGGEFCTPPDNPASPRAALRRLHGGAQFPLKRVIRLRGFGRFWCDGRFRRDGRPVFRRFGSGGRRVGLRRGRRVGLRRGRRVGLRRGLDRRLRRRLLLLFDDFLESPRLCFLDGRLLLCDVLLLLSHRRGRERARPLRRLRRERRREVEVVVLLEQAFGDALERVQPEALPSRVPGQTAAAGRLRRRGSSSRNGLRGGDGGPRAAERRLEYRGRRLRRRRRGAGAGERPGTVFRGFPLRRAFRRERRRRERRRSRTGCRRGCPRARRALYCRARREREGLRSARGRAVGSRRPARSPRAARRPASRSDASRARRGRAPPGPEDHRPRPR